MSTDTQQLTGRYTIDPSHSSIGFRARHAMVTKVRGTFDEYDGQATIDGENLGASTASITIQTASVDTRSADRDGHLRSDDFFAVENYPEISFRSTSVQATGENTADVTGDLTIKDVTRSITVPFEFIGIATDPFGNVRAGFEGSVVVNRKDYGLTWNAALETGGFLVSEKVTLEFDISAVKDA